VPAYPCEKKNGPDLHYEYFLIGQDVSNQTKQFQEPGRLEFKDLEPYTEYAFMYRYVNTVGSSPISEPVNFTTLEDRE
jgi:hypothetical protein